MDAASRGRSRCREQEAVGANSSCKLEGTVNAEDMAAVWDDPWPVIERRVPGVRAAFRQRGWPLPPRIDRVYVIAKVRRVLGYQPRFGITELLRQEAA